MSKELERRTIDEIIVRYELEPDLCDVYVEGVTDAGFIQCFLLCSNLKSVRVYAIDTIEVDSDAVRSAGYNVGNKGRVLTLSDALSKQWESLQATFIVDADLDAFLPTVPSYKSSLSTDFPSLESYFFTYDIFTKICGILFYDIVPDVDRLFASIRQVIHDLFHVRVANTCLGWNLKAVSFIASCKENGTDVSLDLDDYLKRYLMANGRWNDVAQFREAMANTRTISDDREMIHGHDLLSLVGWFVRRKRPGVKFATESELLKAVFLASSFGDLAGYGMFKTLFWRAKAKTAPANRASGHPVSSSPEKS